MRLEPENIHDERAVELYFQDTSSDTSRDGRMK